MYSRYLVGKLDTDGKWLPLTVHLHDTVGVADYLIREWVSDSQIEACHLDASSFRKVVLLAASLHDIAKATSYFQGMITDKCPYFADRLNAHGFVLCYGPLYRGRTPHDHAGEWILKSELFDFPESFTAVIGAHHGKPMSDAGVNGSDNMLEMYPVNFYGREKDAQQKNMWASLWKMIVQEGLKISGFLSKDEIPILKVEAQILISALLITADWIASNTYYFPLIGMDEMIAEDDYDKRLKHGLRKLRFPDNWESVVCRMNEVIFSQRFCFQPNDMQKSVYQAVNETDCPGIFILEAQMGIGKTEAALSAAEVIAAKCHSKGIFFGLPTQATCNGIYDRLYQWADAVSEDTLNAIRMAHGGAMYDKNYLQQVIQGEAHINDEREENGTLVHPWFQQNKRALLADFVIGTVDQFLMTSLKQKHFMLKHLGLAGKVVVIDECHSYSAYTNKYLSKSLEWMGRYGVPVILLSATLPSSIRTEFVNSYLIGRKAKNPDVNDNWKNSRGYPLLTWTDGNVIHQIEIQQSIDKKMIDIDYIREKTGVMATIRDKLQDGGCACIILNTVKSAQSYYDSLKEEFPGWNILLYHAQFTMEDRLEKERKLIDAMGKNSTKDQRDRFILVGTQVLEQSLDYDADIMFTQLCPIDLFLQRIGRLHRHRRDESNYSPRPEKLKAPKCYLLLDGDVGVGYDEGTGYIYGDYLLTRSMKIMPEQINIPEDIPVLVQRVYDDKDNLGMCGEEGYKKIQEEHLIAIAKSKKKADTFLLNIPRKNIFGMLDNSPVFDEEDGGRSVRDGDISIEIIILRQDDDGIRLLNSDPEKPCYHLNDMPDEGNCIEIARQRVRLPHMFVKKNMVSNVIYELNSRQDQFELWKNSAWLKGECIVLLNSNGKTTLCGFELSYDHETGLKCKKREE